MNFGTSRKERTSSLLDPASIQLDGRTLAQLYEETKDFAKTVVFEEDGVHTTWETLFENGSRFLKAMEEGSLNPMSERDCPPHLGLFLAFLKLFQSVQQEYNTLYGQHIKFFYQKILNQKAFGMKEDHVYVFFELARNISKYHLEKGTGMLAGKDQDKNDITYRTDKAVFLNKAKVVAHHAIFNGKGIKDSIYVYKNVSQIRSAIDTSDAIENNNTGWYPFGNRDLLRSSASLGFGISVPILDLQEGDRTIKIILKIKSRTQQTLPKSKLDASLMEAHLSIADGWLIKPLEKLSHAEDTLLFEIGLNKMDPPLQLVHENTEDVFKNLSYPVVKIVLKQGYSFQDYTLLQTLQVYNIDVEVKVMGMQNLIVKNDHGLLDSGQDMQPFGFTPMIGANLLIHARELSTKNLDTGTVTLKWKGLPGNFKSYYEGYKGETNSLVERKEDFKVALSIRQDKEWISLAPATGAHFNLFDEQIQFQVPLHKQKRLGPIGQEEGIIKTTLVAPEHAFGHGIYPSVYTKAIMAQLQQKDAPIPSPPYTPTVEGIELDYEASYSFDVGTKQVEHQSFFHVEPFGANFHVLPKTTFNLISTNFQYGGQLFLGIEKLNPPEQLNLFFEIKEENVLEKPGIEIGYLVETGWTKFSKNQLLSDTTLGLKQTGIITLNVPPEATSETDLMPRGLFWIRLTTKAFPERFDRLVTIRSNAVRCTLDDSKLAKGHQMNGLIANSIKSFAEKRGQVKKIEQPYPSFGGSQAESDLEFFTRVSERLAHKNRGVTFWDIERIVLEEFTEIYQVICHSHTDEFGSHRPGHIHLIAIPKVNPLEENSIRKPLSSAALLEKIKNYLCDRISPHVRLSVGNPKYEEVQVHATVSFQNEVDAGFYLAKLEEDIKKYLSPWAYGKNLKLEMGSSFYKSSLIKFIELLPYINFVARVQVNKDNKHVRANEISAGPNAILITSNRHKLDAVAPDSMLCQTNQGIAQMIVDINFQVE